MRSHKRRVLPNILMGCGLVCGRAAGYRADGIALPKPQVGGLPPPAGLGRPWADRLWVTATRDNGVLLVARAAGRVEQRVSVGVAPYMVVGARPDRCYVSNWGGDPPRE